MEIKQIEKKELDLDQSIATYTPDREEKVLQTYVGKRVREMKAYRKSLGVEKMWDEADKEYLPKQRDFGITSQSRKILVETDQIVGLRAGSVPVDVDGTGNWRSSNSDPTLLAKMQTAIAILIDKNPEAVLTALEKKYEGNTALANALWKRNWEITNSKEVLKLFTFNLMKYGWAVGRSHPRVIKYKKEVLKELDPENPDNNKYEEQENVWFNDLWRESLDPKKTWIDEQTRPYNPYSTNDCYYEIDYSYDGAKAEFDRYTNFKYVKRDSKNLDTKDKEKSKKEDNDVRKDIITIGFYQNRLKDLYVIWIPKDKIILHYSPLPNDDGFLDIWHSLWILRDANSPYGVSLWQIIKQDKELYDKMINMSMDQLLLSIMKMFFYTGTQPLQEGDGQIRIEPGVGKQLLNGDVKWMEIPGPGKDAWQGMDWLKKKLDSNSGVTDFFSNSTNAPKGKQSLGILLKQQEDILNRLKTPLQNIAAAVEMDAYISLSWMAQIYATPEIKEFTSMKELQDYEQENQVEHTQLFKVEGQDGLKATFLPQLALHLEDRNGQLEEGKKSKFFQVGKQIKAGMLKWRGIFRINEKSIMQSSPELTKQRKMEVFNLLVPLLQFPPQLAAKPVKQLLKINEEDPDDWLPDEWVQFLNQKQDSLFIQPMQQMQQGMMQQQGGGQSMQAQMGTQPMQGQTVVPNSQMQKPNVPGLTSKLKSFFGA